MGFFTGLDAEAFDRSYEDRELLRRMAGYFRRHTSRLLGAAFGVLMIAGAYAAVPMIVSRAVDVIGPQKDARQLWIFSTILFAIGVLIWLVNWWRRRLTARAIYDVMLDLRRDAFRAAATRDLSFFDEFSSGRIVSRISSDTNEFAQVVVIITDLVSHLLEALILFGVLINIEWRLTIGMLGFLPLVYLVAISFRKIARRVTRGGFRAMANVNASIKEAVTGISIAKNFRQEAKIYHEFVETNTQSYRVNVKRGFVLAAVFPTLNALGGVGTGLILYFGGLNAAQGAVTIGAWYLFIVSLDHFWWPVLNLSSFWTQIQNGLSAAERVFALIDAESEVVQHAQLPVPQLRGEIEFIEVDFHYQPEEPVMETFSLRVAPGESLAIVGHTGAGKSSIVKMIARFYEFQGGQLLIDGQDVRSFDLHQYRSQLGIVSQVPFLFSGTVADNLRYSNPTASEASLLAIANQIGEGEWLHSLPDGLNTQVGERGGRLSMGQRQLVSLLRVLVQKPAIFIFDEATASIDPFTEAQIQEALRLILQESTAILIAHRLSTIKSADRIIVLHRGCILEQGNHQQLMLQGGHYSDLYRTYFRHQSLDYRPSGMEEVDGRLVFRSTAGLD